jgi:hypothetical protein
VEPQMVFAVYQLGAEQQAAQIVLEWNADAAA